MPVIDGSTTASTAAAVTAASIALPPSCSTFSPAADASGWLVAIIPLRPITAERVPWVLAAGRSPGSGRTRSGFCCADETAIVTKVRSAIVEKRFIRSPDVAQASGLPEKASRQPVEQQRQRL